jgi:hypothetical protein
LRLRRRLVKITLLLCCAGVAATGVAAEWSVHVLPGPVATNVAPLRLGLQAGFLDGRFHPLRAECLTGLDWSAETGVTLETLAVTSPTNRTMRVTNGGAERLGITQVTRTLRSGVGYTLRLQGRRVAGKGRVWVTFQPVGGKSEDGVTERFSLSGGWKSCEAHAVLKRETAYRCRLAVEPGSVIELSALSLMPDDAEEGWDHETLVALRGMSPSVIGWPAANELGAYVWYDGVGPQAVRRPAVPSAIPEEAHAFGTAEFVAFCRLIGAEPMLRVRMFEPGMVDERVPDQTAGVQMAAEWVAYCNATGDHPLALLRQRHGHPEPLRVMRWELIARGGTDGPSAASVAAYTAAMRAEDPAICVTVSDDATLSPRSDPYVAEILRRLAVAPPDERAYYGEWYNALGLACAVLDRVEQGRCGFLATPLQPEQVLYRASRARNMLTDAGVLLALINRYPADRPVLIEGVPNTPDSSLRVQAAWSTEAGELIVFVYNAVPEAHTVRIGLAPLKRRFVLYVSEQLAPDLTARRDAQTMPVTHTQKVGSALSQTVVCEAAPCSITRLLVKE